jgi:2-polyprenyl-3-methyl-5-hydroxy-6-metoxy-1,4-benzoquinol methylase
MSEVDEIQKLYRTSPAGVRSGISGLDEANRTYGTYVNFVAQLATLPARILDVGCGTGWSSRLLARHGFDVVGTDLNCAAFGGAEERCSFVTSSVLELPFPDASFDVVAAYQTLEHVPDPRQALREMLRVVRRGGFVVVVGPNLLSPLLGLRAMFWWPWKSRSLRRAFVRDEGMPRHAAGNTIPEAMLAFVRHNVLLVSKFFRREPAFTMRVPDTRPPFVADNDACYLCNPVDLCGFFRAAGCQIEARGRPKRPGALAWLFGGTFVAARKAERG